MTNQESVVVDGGSVEMLPRAEPLVHGQGCPTKTVATAHSRSRISDRPAILQNTQATSPYLNRPLRSLEEAKRDVAMGIGASGTRATPVAGKPETVRPNPLHGAASQIMDVVHRELERQADA